MIDGRNTSYEWQTHPTDILVLPVGAFEQHSVHLPLDTDSIQVEFFSRMVAEELDAALLPTLHIATSMEHTGFRGTFSLRPETLMQIVRDTAEEAQRQNFRFLIIMNGHGGNHALLPACRDINRRDGPLKILLVDYWTFEDRPKIVTATKNGPNFHCEEMETSIILVLAPELVRSERADADYPEEEWPLGQADLTTFGVGHLNPRGAIGWPSLGSREKGEAAIKAVRERLIPYLKNRIERLRKQPRYAGPGGLAIRKMLALDIPAAMRLKHIAGWNQTEYTWEMLLRTNADGCFVMVHNGHVVGTVTTCNYENKVAWIGMVLVDPEFRRMGIATRLLNHAIDSLAGRCSTLKLDATAEGKKVYDRLGFVEQGLVKRLCINVLPRLSGPPTTATRIAETDLPAIYEKDHGIFGVDRSVVLQALWKQAPDLCWKRVLDGQVTAYRFGREGSQFYQIGPLVAESDDDALTLTRGVMAQLHGRPVMLDIMDEREEFQHFLEEIGFYEQRSFVRMVKGADTYSGIRRKQYATAGPELG